MLILSCLENKWWKEAYKEAKERFQRELWDKRNSLDMHQFWNEYEQLYSVFWKEKTQPALKEKFKDVRLKFFKDWFNKKSQ